MVKIIFQTGPKIILHWLTCGLIWPWIYCLTSCSVVMKSVAGPANRQPLPLSRQDSCICSDTLLMLVHPKTTHVLYEQPSVGPWTGIAHLVDQDEPGFERLSSTSSSTILASTRRGSVRRTVASGENSWRWLCPAKDAPPDDDDDVTSDMSYCGATCIR